MDIPFVVEKFSWESKAGKEPVYKVSFKNSNGHKLILVSGSKRIFEDFPKGETVNVKVSKPVQRTLEIPGEHEE